MHRYETRRLTIGIVLIIIGAVLWTNGSLFWAYFGGVTFLIGLGFIIDFSGKKLKRYLGL